MILITGGLGYIGIHVVLELIKDGKEVIILDNLSNSSLDNLSRLNTKYKKNIIFINADLRTPSEYDFLFEKYKINAVIHFAAFKDVEESLKHPIKYYDNNIISTIELLKLMEIHDVKNFVFSSSATVYGNTNTVPIKEEEKLAVSNPYGKSKLIIEEILRDLMQKEDWNIAILRYFNPVGADSGGLINAYSNKVSSNLMNVIVQVAAKERGKLKVYGSNYSTSDGTTIRDFIHVSDLAEGHLSALDTIIKKNFSVTLNLGTGKGCSVLELIKTFESVNKIKIPIEFVERRKGDIEKSIADSTLAKSKINWQANRSIEQMCLDSWKSYKKYN